VVPTTAHVKPSHGHVSKQEKIVPLIKANAGVVTQINVFTVPHGAQQPLIDLLAESAEFASTIPGWLSASLHRSRDGTRVVNYAQSDSPVAAKLIIDRLRAAGYLDRNKAMGEAHPGLYDVVFTLER
jgi:Antibiotic biosynthesis monooxygenase